METVKKLKRNFAARGIISMIFALSFSLTFNVANVSAVCNDGTLESTEECDGGVGPDKARGDAATCADLGDTDPITSGLPITCNADCTINSSMCSGGFVAPPQPGNVPEEFDTAVMNATNWLLGFVGMIAVLIIIWGGINYIASAGDEERARTAKKTITYGLIGVVIAGFAYAVVNVIVTTILT